MLPNVAQAVYGLSDEKKRTQDQTELRQALKPNKFNSLREHLLAQSLSPNQPKHKTGALRDGNVLNQINERITQANQKIENLQKQLDEQQKKKDRGKSNDTGSSRTHRSDSGNRLLGGQIASHMNTVSNEYSLASEAQRTPIGRKHNS